jgi:SHS2 domain-containing protein
MHFEYLDHPADIGFRAWGNTVEELFANCAHALQSLILDPEQITGLDTCVLEASGADQESLLVNWLNEVLFYIDTRRLAFSAFQIRFTSPFAIECKAQGEMRDTAKHPVRLFVKAVTYHQLRISNDREQLQAEVYVDV